MVYSDKTLKIQRLQARDHVSEQKASALAELQMPDEKKMEKSDFVIFNNGSRQQLEKDVEQLYKKILAQ